MKRTSKKALTATVGIIAALSLFAAACGSDDDDDQVSTGDEQSTDVTTRNETPADTVIENAPGFDGETIKLGFLTDLSGALAIIGGPIRDGAQIYWDYVNNELGGIGGKYQVELVVEDTADNPATAVQGYQKIKDDVVLFAEVLSTPPTSAVLEQLKIDGILAVPGSLAGQWTNERYLIPNGAPYEYEMINLLDWWYNTQSEGGDVYCVVYVNDLYGQESLKGFTYAADQLGIDVVESVTINRGDSSFTAQVTQLSSAGCTVVGAITVPTEQFGLMRESLQSGFNPVWLGALPAYLNLFAATEAADAVFDKFYVALDAPSVSDRSVEGIDNFRNRHDEYAETPFSTFKLSGYFQSFSVHQLLEKAVEMGDLSREGLLAAYAQLGEVDVEGLAATNYFYGEPGDRIPTTASRIFEHDRSVPEDFLNELTIHESPLIAGFSFS